MDAVLLVATAAIVSAPLFYYIFKVKKNDEHLDTKTSGTITLFTETSCKSLVEALVNAFHEANPNARIEMKSGSEKEAFDALQNDTSRLVVLQRSLTEKELQGFHARYFVPRSAPFAIENKTGQAEKTFVLFNNQSRDGLGVAFTTFVTGEKGRKVVTDFGFLPAAGKNKPFKKAA